MDVMTRVLFVDDNREKFFGEGPYRLLRGIAQTGSLRQAAASMGMAYTKALKILKRAEEVLGFPLTERTAGGSAGGGSSLTPEGKEWIERYASYRDACAQANRALYLEFFPEQREAAPDSDGEPRER